jgi:hypothetical protein
MSSIRTAPLDPAAADRADGGQAHGHLGTRLSIFWSSLLS